MTTPAILKTIFSRRMIVAALMGFNCGLPLLLTSTVLQAWMKESGVDLEIIGLMALVGLPNRLFFALAGSIFCVFVEILLNLMDALTWDYSWWSVRAPWLIILLGYFPFFMVSFWVYDMKTIKRKAITVGGIYLFNLVCLILFMGILKWI